VEAREADSAAEGAVSETVRDCVTGAVVLGGIVILSGLQLVSKGSPFDAPVGAHVIATVPVNMPLGVTVTGIVAVSGAVPVVAVIVPLPPLTVKLPGLLTVIVTAVAEDVA